VSRPSRADDRLPFSVACFGRDPCDATDLIDPVHVYGRSEGVSITGGFVYRGGALPRLIGAYLFADFG
jgi:hypothetical protein